MPSIGTLKIEAEVIIRWTCPAILPLSEDEREALVYTEAEVLLNSLNEKLGSFTTESGVRIYPRFHFKEIKK